MGGVKSNNSFEIWKLKIEKQEFPYFTKLTKDGDKWVEGEHFPGFQGIIEGVEFDEYEHKGEMNKTMILYMHDNGVRQKLEMNLNGLAKNIINTFSSAKDLAGAVVMFRVYNKNNYANIYIEINGKKGEWEYDAKKVKPMWDKDDRWIDMANKHVLPQFEGYEKLPAEGVTDEIPSAEMPSEPKSQAPSAKELAEVADAEEGDLPF